MKFLRLIFAALAALFLATALAQSGTAVTKTVGETATLSWTAPTTYTDGTAIPSTVTITYNVYEATQAVGTNCSSPTYSTTPTVAAVSALTYTLPAYTATGVYCYALTAETSGMQSALTNSVEVDVTLPTPNPPTGLTAH
jgi:hypothetical protein